MFIEEIISESLDSNIYIINNSTLIDSGLDPNRTIKKVSKITDIGHIKTILLTHGHFDHFGGIYGFLNNDNLKIGVSKHEINSLNDTNLSASYIFGKKIKNNIVPNLILKENNVINIGFNSYTKRNEYLKVIETPGHTIGSLSFYSEEYEILFSGDTLFSNGIGRTDFVNSAPYLMKESINKIMSLKLNKIYPGHGSPISGYSNIKSSLLNSYNQSLMLY